MRSILPLSLFFSPFFLHAQGLTPEESIKAMKLPEGFSVQCVAHEPMIRQPLSISFDDRGRMWVLQYLQYPNYAELKPIKQDQYLRTIWDKFPEPPPKGPKGLDKLTILWDVGPDGKYRKSKDFVSGLNIASGFCLGHGGVYIAQPPYLLFYPDRNRDDLPDTDPEVLLTGFGMDDTHSLANSLQWGPDGWLYGAAGSTSTSRIKNPANPDETIEFQQGIWRYHPATKRFELFSEGGGNTYGLDFDRFGRAIAGTNWGSKAMLYQMQGAYYVKGFSKHGPLHNSYAFGYFDHVPYENFKGGHVTCGGIVYEATLFPKEYQQQYIAANLLSNSIYMHRMEEKGSSFTAKHGADLLISSDPWFRPIDCLLGPDECVYIVDWYDKRAAHLDPIDNWDKTNGRIYRIAYRGAKPIPQMNLAEESQPELLELLNHPNQWYRREAQRILVESAKEKSLNLEWNAKESLNQYLVRFQIEQDSMLRESLVLRMLHHPQAEIRAWGIRLIGDDLPGVSNLHVKLIDISKQEKSLPVLCQLACTAKRLTGQSAIAILMNLIMRDEFANDPWLPMLIWWGLEQHTITHAKLIIDQIGQEKDRIWKAPIFQSIIAERLIQRLTAEKKYQECSILFEHHPPDAIRRAFAIGMEAGLKPYRLVQPPEGISKTFQTELGQYQTAPEIKLSIRLGFSGAIDRAFTIAEQPTLATPTRIDWIRFFGAIGGDDCQQYLLNKLEQQQSDPERTATIAALQGFDSNSVRDRLLKLYPTLKGDSRSQAKAILLSRAESARLLIDEIAMNRLPKTEITLDQLRPLIEMNDVNLTSMIEKRYGKLTASTPGEKRARISWLNVQLPRGKGDAKLGKELFSKQCATCHQLFGEGNRIGPDLTTSDRKNRTYLLTHIIDPSLYIRPEYLSQSVITADGRRLSGIATTEGSDLVLTQIINNVEQKTKLNPNEIESIKPSPVSLMPEKILDSLSEDEIRHLFAYLQSDPPPESKSTPQAQPKQTKLKIVLVSGSLEYESDESLSEIQKYLEANYPVECIRAFRKTDADLPGLEHLKNCDLAIFYTRRLTIEGDQLKQIKAYLESGKPVIGIRTASHGFQKYLEMDRDIFGGDYKGHHGKDIPCQVSIADGKKDHPILKNVQPYISSGSLYKNANPSNDIEVLLTGSIPKFQYPVAWVRQKKEQRIFYTSLGHQKDFKNENFRKLLVNAIAWTTRSEWK